MILMKVLALFACQLILLGEKLVKLLQSLFVQYRQLEVDRSVIISRRASLCEITTLIKLRRRRRSYR